MAEEKTKTKRWQQYLLVGSLAANLAVLGIVAGVVFGGGPRDRIQRFDLTVGPLTRAMEPDRQETLRATLRESGAFRAVDRQNMRSDAEALLANLRAETFDPQGFQNILNRQSERLKFGQNAVLRGVIAQISEMTRDERAAFADRLTEQMRRSGPLRERSGG